MTVPNPYSPARYSISGYDYDFSFKIDAVTELLVYTITNDVLTTLTYGVDYIADLDEISEGGSIQTGSYVMAVWTPAEPSGDEILITRSTPYTQDTNIPVRGSLSESALEGALDHLSKQIQQLKYQFDLISDEDLEAGQTVLAAAQAAQAAAEAAQTAAEAAQAGAEAAATTAIDDALDPTTGHDHDGVNSKKVLVTDLDVTGITDQQFLMRDGAAIAGADINTGFNLVETVELTAAVTTGNITLDPTKYYKLKLMLVPFDNDGSGGASMKFYLRFNADSSGNNYHYHISQKKWTAVTTVTTGDSGAESQNQIYLHNSADALTINIANNKSTRIIIDLDIFPINADVDSAHVGAIIAGTFKAVKANTAYDNIISELHGGYDGAAVSSVAILVDTNSTTTPVVNGRYWLYEYAQS